MLYGYRQTPKKHLSYLVVENIGTAKNLGIPLSPLSRVRVQAVLSPASAYGFGPLHG